MTKTITIARREERAINGRDILNIWDKRGTRYTHFIEPRNEGWEETLQEGKQVRVYTTQKDNPENPKYPYRNIYKPNQEETIEIPFTEGEDATAKETTFEEELAQKNESDKSERIRWMNSLNNACRLVQGQVIKVDTRDPMKSIVNLANVLYKLEPQKQA